MRTETDGGKGTGKAITSCRCFLAAAPKPGSRSLSPLLALMEQQSWHTGRLAAKEAGKTELSALAWQKKGPAVSC